MQGNDTWVDQMLSLTERRDSRRDPRWEAAALLAASRHVVDDHTAMEHLGRDPNAALVPLAVALATAPALPEEAYAPGAPGSSPEALEVFLRALARAGAAIARCRRELHPAGACWFCPEDGSADVCDALLCATHAVGTRALTSA